MITKKGIRTAILPVGGKGTRIGPMSTILPKHLFPFPYRDSSGAIQYVPVIQLVIQELIKVGVEKFILVINNQDRSTLQYFESAEDKLQECKNSGRDSLARAYDNIVSISDYINIVCQSSGSGDAVAILSGLKHAIDCNNLENRYLVYFPDNLLENYSELKRLIDVSNHMTVPLIGSMTVPKAEAYKYGILNYETIPSYQVDMQKVISFIEKPAGDQDLPLQGSLSSYQAGNGIFILTKDFIEHLANIQNDFDFCDGEFRIADGLTSWVRNTLPLYVQNMGAIFDIGSPEGILSYTSHCNDLINNVGGVTSYFRELDDTKHMLYERSIDIMKSPL